MIPTEDTDGVLSVAFSLDDTLLASTNHDKTVRVWDVRTGTELWTMQGHKDKPTDVAFSPDGKLLASASEDETIRLWEVSTGTHLRTLEGHIGGVTSASVSSRWKAVGECKRGQNRSSVGYGNREIAASHS